MSGGGSYGGGSDAEGRAGEGGKRVVHGPFVAGIEPAALTPWFQSVHLKNMRRPPKPSPLGAIIILRQMRKHEWLFTLPRITEEVDDRLEEGIDWIDADPHRAASIFLRLIEEYPEPMDAHHHLALTLEEAGKREEAFRIWYMAGLWRCFSWAG